MNTPQQSLLAHANSAFRQRDFKNALALYDEALRKSKEPLKSLIQFNRDLAFRRLGATAQATAIALEKPENMEEYYFNLIKEGDFFDPAWYLTQYKEKHQVTDNPLAHYLAHGVALSTNPSPHFDTAYYVKTHQDVTTSGMHPFLHYVCQGHKEDRPAKPGELDDSLDQYPVEAPQYVPRLAPDAPSFEKAARVIAFYLPQFHPIPENDAWWGKGFTEWTNVKPAKPQFEGHYQPHVPDDFLGYYDLRDTAVMRKQIELAKQYGIEGFCFYTYWFTGHRLLETPVDNYLADKALDHPFCVCWANENWSRRWDGLDQDLLMVQHYSPEDDIAFIAHMSKYLRDPRYIRVQGRPLLIVYRPNLFPSMKETAQRWRGWCRENGLGEIYIAYVQSFEKRDPTEYGLDAAIEFPPNNSAPPEITEKIAEPRPDFSGNVYDWRVFMQRSEDYSAETYTLFRGACPSWDNTARKKERGTIFTQSSPKLFERLLVNTLNDAARRTEDYDERLVFINAWNEWAEGAHLEPDRRYGYAWLESIRNAHTITTELQKIRTALVVHAYYPEILQEIMDSILWMSKKTTSIYLTTNASQEQAVRKILSKYDYNVYIFVVENRGRDVLPFIQILPQVLSDGTDLVLKIHTKKSLHRIDGDLWRKELYGVLLSHQFITETQVALVTDDLFGVSAPSDHIVPMSYYWGSNEANILSLCRRMEWVSPDFEGSQFVAGTMFAASTKLLQRLLDLKLTSADFEVEEGQVDGTMAHALERFIGFLCHKENHKLLSYGARCDDDFKFAKRG